MAKQCAFWWIREEGDLLIPKYSCQSCEQNNPSVASTVVSWYAEVVAMKTCWQLLVIHGVLGQCLATQAEKRSDDRQRQAEIKGKGSLLLPPHSAPPASSHSGVMKASTHTFHPAFRVQNVRVWPLRLWSSPKSTPVLADRAMESHKSF